MGTVRFSFRRPRRPPPGPGGAPSPATRLSPPACPGDFPDPFVLPVGDRFFAFGTNHGGINVQVRASGDLVSWDRRPDALPALPGWGKAGWTWSPAVLERDGTFVLWYVLREPRSGRQAVSVAVATEPGGPYTDRSSGPAVFQLDQGGSIDPSPFVDADGQPYLLWKADANALDRPSSLWGQRLSADGRSLEGTPTRLLGHDRPWERPLIEAPCMVRAGSRYWLLYSAGWWASPGYAIGLASGATPLGPFDKHTMDGPWAASDRTAAGPGGQEVFTDRAGRLRLAYHAWEPGAVGYPAGQRSLRIGHLDLSGPVPALRP
jgi:beta-xylosidase